MNVLRYLIEFLAGLGNALFFFAEVLYKVFWGRIRWPEVLKQVYEQGIQSVIIIALTSFASGAVLAMQGYVVLSRFGAKEYIAQLVGLSLVRELSPVFSSLIFSGKAGSRMAAELGTMNVNEQITATRTMGVDPIEFLVIPRMMACFIVLPILVIISEIIGITGGYMVGVYDAHVASITYIHQTMHSINFVDFFSGLIKTYIFAVLIGWVCCYQGYSTKGGSLGVGQYTTRAVALAYVLVIVSNTILTKLILTFWG